MFSRNDNLKRFHFDKGFFDAPKRYGHLLLFQAGDISCKAGYRIPSHLQLCYELSYITSGRGVYRTNGVEEQVSKGMLYLNLPGQMHEGIADPSDPFRYYYIGFDFADAQSSNNEYLDIKATLDSVKHNTIRDNGDHQSKFIGLLYELLYPAKHSAQMVNLYLQQIVITTYRSLQDEKVAVDTAGQYIDNSRQLVYQIVNFIDTKLPALSELSKLADTLGYSHSYLSHLFSRETGTTIQGYFSQCRLEKAAEMLISTQCNVTVVSELFNYGSVHAFSKAFKAHFHITPSEYQRLNIKH